MTDHTSIAGHIGRHVVVLSHPGTDSFNHAIARAYCDAVRFAGQEVVFRDLYAIGFDPVLTAAEKPGTAHPHADRDVADELELIRRSDVFVLIYPIWFGGPPAMMKGYVDRVFGAGVVPRAVQAGEPTSLLGRRRLLSFTTSGLSDIWLDEQGQQSALLTVFDRYLAHAFGMDTPRHQHFDHITDALSEHNGRQHLQKVKDEAARTCAEIVRSRAPTPMLEESR